tara:strand:- start:317 stop:499 length:183 start_codon:yes stop_codon:yes gene_type:complete
MVFTYFALASSEWGVNRFTTDVIALAALGILIYLPVLLLRNRIQTKSLWSDGNAISKRFD